MRRRVCGGEESCGECEGGMQEVIATLHDASDMVVLELISQRSQWEARSWPSQGFSAGVRLMSHSGMNVFADFE